MNTTVETKKHRNHFSDFRNGLYISCGIMICVWVIAFLTSGFASMVRLAEISTLAWAFSNTGVFFMLLISSEWENRGIPPLRRDS